MTNNQLNAAAAVSKLRETTMGRARMAAPPPTATPDLDALPRVENRDLSFGEVVKQLLVRGYDVDHPTFRAMSVAQLNDVLRRHEADVAAGRRQPNGTLLPTTAAGGPATKTAMTQPAADGSQVSQKYPTGAVRMFSADSAPVTLSARGRKVAAAIKHTSPNAYRRLTGK